MEHVFYTRGSKDSVYTGFSTLIHFLQFCNAEFGHSGQGCFLSLIVRRTHVNAV